MGIAPDSIGRCLIALVCLLTVTGVRAQEPAADGETAASSAPAVAIDSFPAEQRHTYNEIQLTPDGVRAVDTTGREWRYEFETETWSPSGSTGEGLTGIRERADDNARNVPVEERCTEEHRVQPYEKSVLVGYDEFVAGDVRAWGRVTVKGWVKGSIVSATGRVLVTETGRVDGDIRSPDILVQPGGVVAGSQIESSTIELGDLTNPFSFDGLNIVLAFTVFFLFGGFLISTLMPRQLALVEQCAREHRIKAFVLGFLAFLLSPVILLVIAITIVGLLVVPLLPFAYLAALVMSVAAFGNRIGRFFCRRFLGIASNITLHVFVGISITMSVWIVDALLLGSSNSAIEGLGIFVLVVAILLSALVLFTGVGGVILTRFGYRPYVGWRLGDGGDRAPAPAPPPIPESPPMPPPIHRPDREPPLPEHPNKL